MPWIHHVFLADDRSDQRRSSDDGIEVTQERELREEGGKSGFRAEGVQFSPFL